MSLASDLDGVLRNAGLPITGVSIGDPADKATWAVCPPTLQAQAAPLIASFNPADPVSVASALEAQVKTALDTERLISAVVWCVIDTLAPPVTKAKYQAARTKIIDAFKAQPWK